MAANEPRLAWCPQPFAACLKWMGNYYYYIVNGDDVNTVWYHQNSLVIYIVYLVSIPSTINTQEVVNYHRSRIT